MNPNTRGAVRYARTAAADTSAVTKIGEPMKKPRLLGLTLGALLGLTTMLPSAILAGSSDPNPPGHKIYICHATASEKNPYVLITVDQNSAQEQAHRSHPGDFPVGSASSSCDGYHDE